MKTLPTLLDLPKSSEEESSKEEEEKAHSASKTAEQREDQMSKTELEGQLRPLSKDKRVDKADVIAGMQVRETRPQGMRTSSCQVSKTKIRRMRERVSAESVEQEVIE